MRPWPVTTPSRAPVVTPPGESVQSPGQRLPEVLASFSGEVRRQQGDEFGGAVVGERSQ